MLLGHAQNFLLEQAWEMARHCTFGNSQWAKIESDLRWLGNTRRFDADPQRPPWHAAMSVSRSRLPTDVGGHQDPRVARASEAIAVDSSLFSPGAGRSWRKSVSTLRISGLLTTAQAAEYCGFRTPGAIRTAAMQAHYSTVSPAEQRASIGKLIQLFGAGGPRNSAGGPPSGSPTPSGGPQNEKTG